jgi:hypothetical protein
MDHFVNGTPMSKRFPIGPAVVLKSNLSQFREAQKERNTRRS